MATAVEYLATTRMGEKGQLTIPKGFRDELDLTAGVPVSVLRIGNGLILIPEQARFRQLCDSLSTALTSHGITRKKLLANLPKVRRQLFEERYPDLAKDTRSKRTKRKVRGR